MAIQINNKLGTVFPLPTSINRGRPIGPTRSIVVAGTKAQITDLLAQPGGGLPFGISLKLVPDAFIDAPAGATDAQDSVLDKDLATPPTAPTLGQRFIVAAAPTGAWVGHAADIAEWNGTSWMFTTPTEGMEVRVEDENLRYEFDGAAWAVAAGGFGGAAERAPVRIATAATLPAYTRTGNVLLADAVGAIAGHASMDGVVPVVGNRVLVMFGPAGQTAHADCGLYAFDAIGAVGTRWQMTRTADADESAKVPSGMYMPVTEGTVNGETIKTLTTEGPITLNTTALEFQNESALFALVGAVSTNSTTGAAAAGTDNRAARGGHTHPFSLAESTAVARPAASLAGRMHYTTDLDGGAIVRDTGIAWEQKTPGASHDHGAATGADGAHDHGDVSGTAPPVTDPGHDHGAATGAGGAHDHGAATGGTVPGFTDPGHDHGAATGSAGAVATTSNTASVTESGPTAQATGWANLSAAGSTALVAQQVAGFDLGADTGAGITQPVAGFGMGDGGRTVQVIFSAGWDGGDIRISGLRMTGVYGTEDILDPGGAGTVQSVHAYFWVGRVRSLGAWTAGTVDVQNGRDVGVPIGALTPALLAVYEQGSGPVPAAAISANGVVDLSGTAPNNARDYLVVYTLATAYTDAGHVHTGGAHTHTVASGTTGATVDSHTHAVAAGTTGATVDSHTHTVAAAVDHIHTVAADTTGLTVDSHTHSTVAVVDHDHTIGTP